MKKFAILLLCLNGTAWAGWKSVAEDDTATTYADPASIVRDGDTVTMWSLLDYKVFQRMVEVGYFSRKVRAEYDCAEPRSRGMSLSLHAEKMGQGKVIYEDTSPQEWEAVAPDTITAILRKVACK